MPIWCIFLYLELLVGKQSVCDEASKLIAQGREIEVLDAWGQEEDFLQQHEEAINRVLR